LIKRHTAIRIAVVASIVLFFSLRVSWISDDALITLRQALNLRHGWGPGFNPLENVQAYTHPLWFSLWVFLGYFTNEWMYSIVLFSLACTALAVALIAYVTRNFLTAVLVAIMLVSSNAFIEYSTSGLENPLSYLLVGIIILCVVRAHSETQFPDWNYAFFGLLCALAFLNRMDYAILLVPPILSVLWPHRRKVRIIATFGISLATPIILWGAYSFTAFHAFLPNTFEAKRNLHIPLWEVLTQGITYILFSMIHDPVSGIILIVGLAVTLRSRAPGIRPLAYGILLYFAYVIYVGGDFMAGRFLAVPVFMTIFLCVLSRPHFSFMSHRVVSSRLVLSIGAALLLVGVNAITPITSIQNPQVPRWRYQSHSGIADERGYFVQGGRRSVQDLFVDRHEPVRTAASIRRIYDPAQISLHEINFLASTWPSAPEHFALPRNVLTVCGQLGALGIGQGPAIHLIDTCGLTDKFLASLPFSAHSFHWRIGHFSRSVPDGYEKAIRLRDPSFVTDPVMRAHLQRLWSHISHTW